jgi:predicted phosphodiesterase
MTAIVFSDTHLTDSFDRRKFVFLKRIISPADRVIINGDFWDGYLTPFDKFIKSQWQELFKILKTKKTVYLYGNHDFKKFADNRVNIFSDRQGLLYKIKVGKYSLIIEHGNRMAPAEDETGPKIFLQPLIIKSFIAYRESIPVKLFSRRALFKYSVQNYKIKKWAKENLKQNEIIMTGHSHLAEINIREQFINTGMIRWGIGQYLKIDGDKMELVDEDY